MELMFCNTYHLLLHPGPQAVEKAGGLHKFINRNGPIITDSGGFQVFSLAYGGVASELKSGGSKKSEGSVIKISEEGVMFRSYRDGSKVFLTPESSVECQKALGADIIVPLDELPPYHMNPSDLVKSLERTHRWEKRSLDRHRQDPQQQAMYAVIHGGLSVDLRKQSIDTLSALPFDGYAIGGSLGKTKGDLHELLQAIMPLMPQGFPVHLLGIGDIENIRRGVPLGVDTFDSAFPTRVARHGSLLMRNGAHILIKKSVYREDYSPIDENCSCSTCLNYSKAYLHHLVKAHEPIFATLASVHNLSVMLRMMEDIRRRILEGEI